MWDKLIGKTIHRIETFEVDSYGDGEHVTPWLTLFFTDGTFTAIDASDPTVSDRFYAEIAITVEVPDTRNVLHDSVRHYGNEINPQDYIGGRVR